MGSTESLSPGVSLEEFLRSPALEPPNGIDPVFDPPPNNNDLVFNAIAACMAIELVFFLFRVYTRLVVVKKARLEDYIGLLALIFQITGICIFSSISKRSGLFVHQWNLSWNDLPDFIYSYVLSTICICLTLMLIKASILLEWTHILVPRGMRNSFFYWACHIMILANSLLYISIIITINFVCAPRDKIWHRWMPGTCINISALNLGIAACNLLFNVMILLLPHRVIWRLALSKPQKIGVSIIFSVGIITCAAAAGRLASAVDMSRNLDTTYAYSMHLLWGLVETTAAILVFCVPAIPIAFRGGVVSRLSTWVGLKTKQLKGVNILPETDEQRHWPQPYRAVSEPTEAHSTRRQPSRNSSRDNVDDESGGVAGLIQMGILRTTKIEITTREGSDSVTSSIHHGTTVYPWSGNP